MFSSSPGTENICAAWQMISATLKVRIGEGWLTISYTARVKSFKKTCVGGWWEPQDFGWCSRLLLNSYKKELICSLLLFPTFLTFVFQQHEEMGWTKGSISRKYRRKVTFIESCGFPITLIIWSCGIPVTQVLSVTRTKALRDYTAIETLLTLIMEFFALHYMPFFF